MLLPKKSQLIKGQTLSIKTYLFTGEKQRVE